MKKQVFNPYLPLDTYIPDGEPHVFGNRVYIYGSHDKEGGDCFCLLDYEAWSAPVDDLTDWRCEGIIYQAKQCRHYCEERQDMYAPECVIHPPVNMNIMEMSAIRTEDLCNGLFPLTQRL